MSVTVLLVLGAEALVRSTSKLAIIAGIRNFAAGDWFNHCGLRNQRPEMAVSVMASFVG